MSREILERCVVTELLPEIGNADSEIINSGNYKVVEALSADEGGHQQLWFEMHAHAFALGNKLVAPKFKKHVVCETAKVLATYNNGTHF